jgi:ABC-type transporter Mla MlaB component
VNCWIGVDHEDGRRIVRLAGELCVAQVADLLKVSNPSLEPMELDLSGLLRADAGGIAALQALRGRVSFTGTPAFIQLRLDSTPLGQVPGNRSGRSRR